MAELDPFAKLNRQGKIITVEEWAKLQGIDEYRFVRRTRLGSVESMSRDHHVTSPAFAWVITLWEGMDPYGFMSEAKRPLIFETSVFKPTTEKRGICLDKNDDQRWAAEDSQVRHATQEEALVHHGMLVAKLIDNRARPVTVDAWGSSYP